MKIDINGNILELVVGDITTLQTDVIVNAANGSLLGGGGVDGAIHRAAGKELLEECKQIREKQLDGNYLPAGEAVITSGQNLPASYVVHTVGPVWNEHDDGQDDVLSNCYQNALELAVTHDASSIAFPSISTGVYHYPVKLAAETALQTMIAFLQNHQFGQVVMVLFSEQDYAAYEKVLHDLVG
ncbi:O-acetyl-ADP-ribose deacetylase [Lentibacillus kimchii]